MKRVVITGLGVLSPIGNDVETFWNNLKNGVSGIDLIKTFDTSNLEVKVAGELKDFDPAAHGLDPSTIRRSDRFTLYAMIASKQAMEDSQLTINPERLGVYIGSGIGGMETFVNQSNKMYQDGPRWVSPLFIPMVISNIAAGNVAIMHNAQGPTLPIVTACATATHSIGEAYRAIKHGYADAIIAGGSESSIHPLAISGFANMKALSKSTDPHAASLPFDKRRQGFVLAEGAGIVILEEYEHAKARGAKIYGEMCGYGNTCDAFHVTAPMPGGESAARAMSLAAEEANLTDQDLIYINAHGTGTPLNDKIETAAIKTAFGEERARQILISSSKSMTGHGLGAAGGFETIASVLALKDGIISPTINLNDPDPECDLDYVPHTARKANITLALSNSLGFGGHNGTLAFRKI
ncbi:MAG TPA: beta-ketoacyl-ACP synthase II [Bacteroidales bacterium]|nr:beta-ketoacyl-ACP synthase II [Bacteroidales bacterium]HOH21745.1 beta-ketoacyl-ACP synthase II [Bacteroidales bacterium]HPB58210.1 beta-ketoacyl-ACP synthase II [Bacteroidales bacterium]HPZ02884.1 beta-ketoacyl-ACP synthase II [Bacteroidales bacterium]HQB74234.1 beta-ketoacyl-ACP synthase II [Bacteroidales bacterium]